MPRHPRGRTSTPDDRASRLLTKHIAETSYYHLSPMEFLSVNSSDEAAKRQGITRPPDGQSAEKYPCGFTRTEGRTLRSFRKRLGGANVLWHSSWRKRLHHLFRVIIAAPGAAMLFERPGIHMGAQSCPPTSAMACMLKSTSYGFESHRRLGMELRADTYASRHV